MMEETMNTDARALPPRIAAELRRLREAEDPRWPRYLLALRRRGYSYAALGNAAGITRQRAHQITRTYTSGEETLLDLPMPPEVHAYPSPADRPVKVVPERAIKPEDAALLKELWVESSERRGSTSVNDPATRAHLFLVALVTLLLRQGFTFPELAEASGAEERTFRGRMWRAGVHAKAVRAS